MRSAVMRPSREGASDLLDAFDLRAALPHDALDCVLQRRVRGGAAAARAEHLHVGDASSMRISQTSPPSARMPGRTSSSAASTRANRGSAASSIVPFSSLRRAFHAPFSEFCSSSQPATARAAGVAPPCRRRSPEVAAARYAAREHVAVGRRSDAAEGDRVIARGVGGAAPQGQREEAAAGTAERVHARPSVRGAPAAIGEHP